MEFVRVTNRIDAIIGPMTDFKRWWPKVLVPGWYPRNPVCGALTSAIHIMIGTT